MEIKAPTGVAKALFEVHCTHGYIHVDVGGAGASQPCNQGDTVRGVGAKVVLWGGGASKPQYGKVITYTIDDWII